MTPSAGTAETIAPRLWRALKDERERLFILDREQRHVRNLIHDTERLIAHRELQEVRAFSNQSAAYIAERSRKLKAAQRTLARLKDQDAAIERRRNPRGREA